MLKLNRFVHHNFDFTVNSLIIFICSKDWPNFHTYKKKGRQTATDDLNVNF